ncbi:MAG TPA: hypothetical protein VFA33_04895 [Bryobacteraceae bacterium]|nr:hypothetical protein [Bryobacteraceae bacterium]
MKLFGKGDVVLVEGPPGRVLGEVLEASTPAEMPDLGPGSCSAEAKAAMREQHVDVLLLIRHKHDDQDVCFFALHNPDGWRDLHGQKLTILKRYELPLTTGN